MLDVASLLLFTECLLVCGEGEGAACLFKCGGGGEEGDGLLLGRLGGEGGERQRVLERVETGRRKPGEAKFSEEFYFIISIN